MIAVQTPRTAANRSLADLAPHIDGYELTARELAVNRRFTRLTTVITLHGAGHRGVGRTPPTRRLASSRSAAPAPCCPSPVTGRWTTFSAALEHMELSPLGPSAADFHDFRRWAFESAALDLALRQAVLTVAALPDDSGRCTLVRVQRRVAARLGAARSTSSGSARCCA
jgi:hypothetical protein